MDQISDNNFTALHSLRKIANALPEYVQEMTKEAKDKLSDALFADKENREYPIDNKSNAFLSALHFATKGNGNQKIAKTLKQASEFFDIKEDIKNALSSLAGTIKVASAEIKQKKYACVTVCGGVAKHFLPINTAEEIGESSRKLASVKSKLPYNTYIHSARNIVNAYNKLDEQSKKLARIDPIIEYEGRTMIIDGSKLMNLLDDRIEKVASEGYGKIKDFIEKHAAEDDQEYLMGIQDLIYQEDRRCNRLDKSYSKFGSERVSNPYLDVNSDANLEESIKFCKENVKIAGVYVPITELSRIKDRVVAYTTKTASDRLYGMIGENKDGIEISKEMSNISMEDQKDILYVVANS